MAIKDIYAAIMDFDETRVADLVNAEIAAGTDVQVILDEGMIAALDVIGQKFSEGTLFVPEMLMAADAVQVGSKSYARFSSIPARSPSAPSCSAPSRAISTISARTWWA